MTAEVKRPSLQPPALVTNLLCRGLECLAAKEYKGHLETVDVIYYIVIFFQLQFRSVNVLDTFCDSIITEVITDYASYFNVLQQSLTLCGPLM